MATIRSRALLPVGSVRWIAEEHDSARQFVDVEVEEFVFSVRNELDWLNEHMDEIFNKQQLNMAEIFKTPGKLRGKTPRTAAKRNPLEKRAPLTDIFTNPQAAPSPSHETRFYQQITKIRVAEDPQVPAREKAVKENSKDNRMGKKDTDSGYHDMSSQETTQRITQETDIDRRSGYHDQSMALEGDSLSLATFRNTKANSSQPKAAPPRMLRSATELSFHSAIEDISQDALVKSTQGNTDDMEVDAVEQHDVVMQEADGTRNAESRSIKQITVQQHSTVSQKPTSIVSPGLSTGESPEEDTRSRTPSDGSSPVRPMMRKNSLKLPSLPAREPLATKRSIGARASRTSHLDQVRTNGTGQASYHGRQPEGSKSTMQRAFHETSGNDDDSDMDEQHDGFHGHGQSDEELKMHHKSSTQRLNEQIYMLGQTRPPRPTKSVSSHVAAHQIYPELPQGDGEKPAIQKQTVENSQQPSAPVTSKPMAFGDNDEEDWIPMKSTSTKPLSRPQLTRADSTESMEQVNGKDSNREARHPTYSVETTYMPKSRSPLRQLLIPERGSSQLGHHISASTSMLPSPARSGIPTDVSVKQVSVSNPNLPSINEGGVSVHNTVTPAGSPTSRRFADGPASAKAKLSSMIKSAKGLFASSASVSAIAKMESFTPPSSRFRDHDQGQAIEAMAKARQESRIVSKYPEGQQYQATDTVMKDVSGNASSSYSPSRAESVMTKSSFEREDKKQEKEAKEREKLAKEQKRLADQLEKAREKERQKAAAYKQEKERVASQEKQIISEGLGSKAVGLQQAELMSKKNQEERRQLGDVHATTEAARTTSVDDDVDMEDASTPAPGTLPSRSQVPQPSQLQKPRELRRPTRPTKTTTVKPKPVPVSIQVYTSQRELDHRKNGQAHPSNSTLATNLQEFLPPPPPKQQQPSFASIASSASLHTSASTNTLKSSVSSMNNRAPPKSSAAAIRKKEQEEREARRKLDQKRDMERKLALQQDEERRKEQDAERLKERGAPVVDPKKIAAHKQAIEKRRLEIARKAEQKNPAPNANARSVNNPIRAVDHDKMLPPPPSHRGELGAGRPPSRANTVGNLRPPPSENYVRPANQPPHPNPARPPKRGHPADAAEEQPFHRPTNAKGVSTYQQMDSKRRRTGEESDGEARQAMPPPKRQSNIRKDGPSKPSGYMAAPAPHGMSHGGSSLLKATTIAQHHMQHGKATQQMEMAKFANAKIPFAENPNAMSHKTPGRSVAPVKSSPGYQNGEDISLPEIPTDSEDEDSENEFQIPSWANTPNLRQGLIDQEMIDPEDVFGPIPPLNMEEVFPKHDRHHRFRNRTSSANWTNDALTQEDIQAYNEERDRLIANGGWVYKMP